MSWYMEIVNIIPAYPAPDFHGIKNWNDGISHTIRDFKGKTVLLDFWTYTCVYCLRMMPKIKYLKEKYNDLEIISIHSAEYNFARDIDNIDWAIKYYHLENYLTGYDLDNKSWELYGNNYWPKFILVDKDGFIRYEHPGYGEVEEFDEAICDLLEIPYSPKSSITGKTNLQSEGNNEIEKIYGTHFPGMAPEICLGYSRLKRFGNNQKAKIDEYNVFTEPSQIFDNIIYLSGKWRWEKEGIRSTLSFKKKSSIILKYSMAKNVNIIIDSADNKPALAEIKIDGKYLNDTQLGYHSKIDNGVSIIETTRPFMNNIIKTETKESHKVEIIPITDNFYFYTFVFG